MSAERPTLFELDGADLSLPPQDRFKDAMSLLDVEQLSRFDDELVDALYEAERSGNLGPVSEVVNAWYRSALFLGQPDFPATLQRAAEDARRLIGQ